MTWNFKGGAGAFWKYLLGFVFPEGIYCICCGKPIDPRTRYSLCYTCVRTLSWVDGGFCQKCGKPLLPESSETLCQDCLSEKRTFDGGYTCVRYGHLERSLIHSLKYGGKSYLARPLAWLMTERLAASGVEEDLVAAVPMNRKKECRRGYNQAGLLAGEIARRRGKPFCSQLLKRTKDTEAMSSLGPLERWENVRGVFSVEPDKAQLISGKTVVLVDDVYTTGSTASACSEVLLAAGAARVFVLTFAAGMDRPLKIE